MTENREPDGPKRPANGASRRKAKPPAQPPPDEPPPPPPPPPPDEQPERPPLALPDGLRFAYGPNARRGQRQTVIASAGGTELYRNVIDLDSDSERRRYSVKVLEEVWPGVVQDDWPPDAIPSLCRSLIELGRAAAAVAEASVFDGDEEDGGGPAPPRYHVAEGQLVLSYQRGDNAVDQLLMNADARIVEDVSLDDGTDEHRRFYRIAGTRFCGRKLPDIRVPAEQFAEMKWVHALWGADVYTYATRGVREHAATGIQILSGRIPKTTVYSHLGWREVNGRWVYLHAGGAIGADGPVGNVCVEPPTPLADFVLPDPPSGAELRDAVRASLMLLDGLAPDRIAIPLLTSPYRAVLGDADYSIGLFGKFNSYKTSAALLAQQHFGAGIITPPANFSSTANAIEALAFVAKDALLLVDDLNHDGSNPLDLRAKSDRVLRAAGNRTGRGRLNRQSTLQAEKPPRSLNLLTGEDLPAGPSARSRNWYIEFAVGDIDTCVLGECQAAAAAGVYAKALAGFIRWVARDKEGVLKAFREDRVRYRSELGTTAEHKRTAHAAGDMLAALAVVLRFAESCGAIEPDAARAILDRGGRMAVDEAEVQAEHIRSVDPVERFLGLLRAALSSGAAHLTDRQGHTPNEHRPLCGWLNDGKDWRPGGRRIGWLAGDNVYLDPDAAYAEIAAMAGRQLEPLSQSRRTLWTGLFKRGHIDQVSERGGKRRNTVPRIVGGVEKEVISLLTSTVFPNAPTLVGSPDTPSESGYSSQLPD